MKVWASIKSCTNKWIKEAKVKSVDSEELDDEKIFRCTEETCTMTYLTLRGLQDHLLVGKHKERKHSDTVVEAGRVKCNCIFMV